MGYSYHRYLVAMDDTLYRMANTAFDRMLSEPTRHRVPELAGQRVRTVEVVVELAGREPVAVVRQAFAVLAFDAAGSVDVTRLRKQQYARIETALAPVFADPQRDEKIVDAGEQFVAQRRHMDAVASTGKGHRERGPWSPKVPAPGRTRQRRLTHLRSATLRHWRLANSAGSSDRAAGKRPVMGTRNRPVPVIQTAWKSSRQ
jgi:hypothetical protein